MGPPLSSVSVGLRTKTARAIAIALIGPPDRPLAVKRAELILASPGEPALFQPYHEVLDHPWDEAQEAVGAPAAELEQRAARALKGLVDALACKTCRIGIVGAPERNLARIGGRHIQAHAAEGVLFRRVWQAAAAASRLPHHTFDERGFEAFFTAHISLPPNATRPRLAAIGQALGRPWRADEKAAAMAAWLALRRITAPTAA